MLQVCALCAPDRAGGGMVRQRSFAMVMMSLLRLADLYNACSMLLAAALISFCASTTCHPFTSQPPPLHRHCFTRANVLALQPQLHSLSTTAFILTLQGMCHAVQHATRVSKMLGRRGEKGDEGGCGTQMPPERMAGPTTRSSLIAALRLGKQESERISKSSSPMPGKCGADR